MNRSKVRQLKLLISAVFLAMASTTTVTSRPSLAESDQPDWGYGGAYNPT